ncbi:MAG: LytTR family DNA-binding domain-containing protein [Myxococcota bacterium]
MTRTLRIALADDEMTARRRMSRLLEAIPNVEVVGVHEGAEPLLDQLRDDAVDVLVLDVQMPGLSGIEAHALLGTEAPYVIFATAHPQHAVEAFELGAVDYVLKPIEASRLGKAVERAREHVQRGVSEAAADPYDRIPVVTREGIVLLDPPSISHAVFDGTLVTVHTTQGEAHLTDSTLADLHARLGDPRFDRVHRRVLLNLREVNVLRPTPSGGFVAVTRAGAEVPISRQSARRMRKALGLSKG